MVARSAWLSCLAYDKLLKRIGALRSMSKVYPDFNLDILMFLINEKRQERFMRSPIRPGGSSPTIGLQRWTCSANRLDCAVAEMQSAILLEIQTGTAQEL